MRVLNKTEIPNKEHNQLIVFDKVKEYDNYGSDSYRSTTDIFILSDEELKEKILKLEKEGLKDYCVQRVKNICKVKIQTTIDL